MFQIQHIIHISIQNHKKESNQVKFNDAGLILLMNVLFDRQKPKPRELKNRTC